MIIVPSHTLGANIIIAYSVTLGASDAKHRHYKSIYIGHIWCNTLPSHIHLPWVKYYHLMFIYIGRIWCQTLASDVCLQLAYLMLNVIIGCLFTVDAYDAKRYHWMFVYSWRIWRQTYYWMFTFGGRVWCQTSLFNVHLQLAHLTQNVIIECSFTTGAAGIKRYHRICTGASDTKRRHRMLVNVRRIRRQTSREETQLRTAHTSTACVSVSLLGPFTLMNVVMNVVMNDVMDVLNANTMACCWNISAQCPLGTSSSCHTFMPVLCQ